MRELCGTGKRRVPSPAIPPFEEDQVKEWARRAGDLGALAELVDAVRGDERFEMLRPTERLLEVSGFRGRLDAASFEWLLESDGRSTRRPPSLHHSMILYEHAGHRQEKALEARCSAVVAELDAERLEALDKADQPSLWGHAGFRAQIGGWIVRDWLAHGRPAGGPREASLRKINGSSRGEPAHRAASPPRELVDYLVGQGLIHAADLVSPEMSRRAQKQTLEGAVIRALCTGSANDPCWEGLANDVVAARSPGPDNTWVRHPVAAIAQVIRDGRGIGSAQRGQLAENGWATFEAAAARHHALLEFRPRREHLPTQQEALPEFELAASLLGSGAVGNAAGLVVAAGGFNRSEVEWWRALWNGIDTCRRRGGVRSVDDRPEVAFAIVEMMVEGLQPSEREAFSKGFG